VLLNRIVDSGSTVVVVEHNQQVIKASDWIIDLGPEGGINGGNVIAVGTPDEIISNKNSVTGKFL
jgi:excinuclease ABC subunit A